MLLLVVDGWRVIDGTYAVIVVAVPYWVVVDVCGGG